MIPIKLELEAFGPFLEKQVLDFTEFNNDKIFLITGKTGSGKTTIFDAISFALYGQASGNIRETDSFKSDFAPVETICYVKFEFIMHNKLYTITREPIQLRKKRNNNIVRENQTAILTLEDGEFISGPTNVDKKIEEIIGINADQFKKIVMLPQGEFRKFLSDDSVEKQKILRKIFSTEILDIFTEKLRQNVLEVKSKIEEQITKCNAYIESINTDDDVLLVAKKQEHKNFELIIAQLKDYINIHKEQVKNFKATIDALTLEKDKLNLPYYIEMNKKYNIFVSVKQDLEELNKKQDYFIEIKKKLVILNSIKDILTIENKIIELKSDKKSTSDEAIRLNNELEISRKTINDINNSFKEISSEYEKISLIVQENEKYKSILDSLNKNIGFKQDIIKIQNDSKNLNSKLGLLSNIKIAIEIQADISNKKERFNLLNKLKKEINLCGKFTDTFLQESSNYKEKMNIFINSQAYFLATKLKENEECPVCGSTCHPSLSKPSDNIISQAQLEVEKEKYELATRKLKEQQGLSKQLLISAGFDISTKSRLSEFLCDIDVEIETLNNQLTQLKSQLSSISIDRDISSYNEKDTQNEINTINTNLALNSQKVENLTKLIEENIAKYDVSNITIDEIKQKINDNQNMIERIKKSYSEISSKRESVLTNYSKLEATIKQLENRILTIDKSLKENIDIFNDMLDKANLDKTSYENGKIEINLIGKFEQALGEYNQDLFAKKSMLESLTEQLNDYIPIDLDSLKQQHDDITLKINESNKLYTNTYSILSSNTDILNKLVSSYDAFSTLDKKYSDMQKIYDVANGKYSDKLNFERYVLASYFNDIINHANIRLEQMTNSRYTLNRRSDKEKGNRASGLDLEVFDAYTGKPRHVNTLSGGESFKISLSLALALADIISANSGGIELNTMFIDEGFGSLDANSLDSAIECLYDIRKTGRYIGIISHVNELKEKIPSKVIVHQNVTGSYISTHV